MIHGKTMMLILSAVACSVSGQLLLKSGAQRLAGLAGVDFVVAAARNVYVLLGLIAWTASTFCWLYVLRTAPLSRAYLLYSLTYVLVPIASLYVFGEQLRRLHVVGMALILLGVATCLLSAE